MQQKQYDPNYSHRHINPHPQFGGGGLPFITPLAPTTTFLNPSPQSTYAMGNASPPPQGHNNSRQGGSAARPPSLPGENGLHTRDGSLLKKKREQWEKEKAELTQLHYPFGHHQQTTPAFQLYGRHSVRRKNPQNSSPNSSDTPNSHQQATISETSPRMGQTGPIISPPQPQQQSVMGGGNQWMGSTTTPSPNQLPHLGPAIPFQHPPPQPVYAVTGSTMNQGSQWMVVPASMMVSPPMATLNASATNQQLVMTHCGAAAGASMAMGSGDGSTAWSLQSPSTTYFNTSSSNMSFTTTGTVMGPSSMGMNGNGREGGAQKFQVAQQFPGGVSPAMAAGSPSAYAVGGSSHESEVEARNIMESQRLLDAHLGQQVEERRRLNDMEAELEIRDSLRTEQVRLELEARHQKEVDEDVRRQERLHATVNLHEKQFTTSWERARLEAEVLRKAKLFRHVLMADNTDKETIHRLLGTEDPQLVSQAMKDVGAFERHKRIEKECHQSSTPSPKGAAGSPNPFKPSITSPERPKLTPHSEKHMCGRPLSPLSGGGRSPLARNALGRGSLKVSPAAKKAQTTPNSSIRKRSGSLERPKLGETETIRPKDSPNPPQTNPTRPSSKVISSAVDSNPPVLWPSQSREKPILDFDETLPPLPRTGMRGGTYHPSAQVQHDATIRLLKGLPESIGPRDGGRRGNGTTSGLRPIGLFEPVRTRSTTQTKERRLVDEVMREGLTTGVATNPNSKPADNINELEVTLRQTHLHNTDNRCTAMSADVKMDTGRGQQSSTGASTMATSSESSTATNTHSGTKEGGSPASSSPPLSGDYKSSSSMEIETSSATLGHSGPLHSDARPPFATPLARKIAEQHHQLKRREAPLLSAGNYLFPDASLPRRQLVSPTMNMLRWQQTQGSRSNSRSASPTQSHNGDGDGDDGGLFSRPLTPSRALSRSSQYRSLNAKNLKSAEKQNKILEQLALVRSQLRERQQRIEKTFTLQLQQPQYPQKTGASVGEGKK